MSMQDLDKKRNALMRKQRYEKLLMPFPIQLKRSKGKGRLVIAADDVEPGTLIMEERPVAFALFKDAMDNVCSYCLHAVSKTSRVPCVKCRKQTFYCSSDCQSKDVIHSLECEIITHLPGIAGCHSVDYTLLRLIIRFIASRSYIKKSSNPDALEHFECVRDMVAHKGSAGELWLNSVQNSAVDLMETFPNKIESSVEEIIQLACQINSNSFVLYDPFSEQHSELGVSLLPLSGLFNHSCSPNAIMYTDSLSRNVLRTVRKVAKGEELTISYIDLYLPTNERRGKLLETKNFWCLCDRCESQTFHDLDAVLCPTCLHSYLQFDDHRYLCNECGKCISLEEYDSIQNEVIKEFESVSDFMKIGNFNGALAALIRFHDNQKTRVSKHHYMIFNSLSTIINSCVKLQKYSMAIDYTRQVISIMNESNFLPDNWPEKADYYFRLGELLEIMQVIDGKSDHLRKEIHDSFAAAWEIRKIAFGANHPATLAALNNLESK